MATTNPHHHHLYIVANQNNPSISGVIVEGYMQKKPLGFKIQRDATFGEEVKFTVTGLEDESGGGGSYNIKGFVHKPDGSTARYAGYYSANQKVGNLTSE